MNSRLRICYNLKISRQKIGGLNMRLQKTECPLVSVIVPTYNNEARIARTLECLISQDYPNIEIIVVNDCSTVIPP